MTLFTKKSCSRCAQLKGRFDLAAMNVQIEDLDTENPAALAHLAWHSLVDTARKKLPILVLDDSSTVADFPNIEHQLAARAVQCGIAYARTGRQKDCIGDQCTF